MTSLAEGLAAFDRNDVSVPSALAHLSPSLDRARLLALRQAGTREATTEARTLIAPLGSAMALAHFVAAPLDLLGAHAEALATRIEALAICPRWESWLAARLLTGIAEGLVELGRAAEGVPAAQRALRFLPGDGFAGGALARALAAAGRAEEAAAVRAWLFDAGFGEVVVAGSPTAADLAATPRLPDLRELEPMTDEEMARHLVYTYVDQTLTNAAAEGRRHAAAQLRMGDLQGALRTLDWYREPGTSNDATMWLGIARLPNTDLVSRDEMEAATLREIARRGVKLDKKLGVQLAQKRSGAALELVASGKAALARPLLFDYVSFVRHDLARALPDDPLVRRAIEIEATILPGGVFGGGLDEYALSAHSHQIGSCTGSTPWGAFPVPPAVPARIGDPPPPDPWSARIERAGATRAKCKVCKEAFGADDLVMWSRHVLAPVEERRWHLACAAKKERDKLGAALGRTRLAIPDREALAASLVTKSKGAKKASPTA